MGRLKVEFDQNISKLQDSYYPRMQPLKLQVYQSLHKRHFLEKDMQWKEKVLAKMQQYSGAFSEEAHMAKDRDEELSLLQPKFQDAIKSLEALTPEDMSVLRRYEFPPQLVAQTLEAVLTLKGEYDTSWEEAKVILSDTYFFGFFINRAKNYDKDNVSEEVLDRIEQIVLNPDFEPVVVAAASIPCGAMCKWVRAIYEYAKLKTILRPSGLPPIEIRTDIERIKEELYISKERVAEAEQKLAALQAEFEQRRLDLKQRYDQTMDPLQETFLEAHHQFNSIFSSPRKTT
eukprot:TRINITY_DN84427_c0_g1_i1.p1 TRINITY_DN84427_c0_g1~~TRINITY_DN84427_c0_g1_i1.p1  ORF type:complete len:318 (+),score=65.63 TRINITY_DN84427_c0_g1_i1:91-954(+)